MIILVTAIVVLTAVLIVSCFRETDDEEETPARACIHPAGRNGFTPP